MTKITMVAGIDLTGRISFTESFMRDLQKRVDPNSEPRKLQVLEATEFGTDGTNRAIHILYQNTDNAGFIGTSYW
jgi:hypothetical protein